jgi:hypothetical protein
MSRASDRREGRSWPGFLLGGRVRTSTVVLLIAFFATWWLFDTYQPAPAPPEQVPATEVVPPGFIPDPAYTWAPRTAVQSRPATSTPTTTPTTTDTEAPTTEPSTSPEATPGAPLTPGATLPPGASTPGGSTPAETRVTETPPASTPPAASTPPISTP